MTTPATPESTDASKAKKGKGKILIMAVAVVVLLGGGGAAYWMYAKGGEPKADAKKAKEEETPQGPGAAIPMDPFVVNLADPGASRFLRVNLSLVVADEEHAKEFEESPVTKAKVRSAILELLALQTADQLITPEGKAELKKTIAEAASMAVSELHISDVLFSEFVVQF